jgi:hypothetical protein
MTQYYLLTKGDQVVGRFDSRRDVFFNFFPTLTDQRKIRMPKLGESAMGYGPEWTWDEITADFPRTQSFRGLLSAGGYALHRCEDN